MSPEAVGWQATSQGREEELMKPEVEERREEKQGPGGVWGHWSFAGIGKFQRLWAAGSKFGARGKSYTSWLEVSTIRSLRRAG